MIARELVAKIKKFRGPIHVEVQNFNDVFYVQAVKSDLVAMIEKSFENQLDEKCGFDLDENGFFGKDFNDDF